jgi:hypothetical protein
MTIMSLCFFFNAVSQKVIDEDSLDELDKNLSVFNRLPTVGYTQGGKFWVKGRRDQELEGARNTKLRQVRAARCVTPYVLYGGLYCLWCRMT